LRLAVQRFAVPKALNIQYELMDDAVSRYGDIRPVQPIRRAVSLDIPRRIAT